VASECHGSLLDAPFGVKHSPSLARAQAESTRTRIATDFLCNSRGFFLLDSQTLNSPRLCNQYGEPLPEAVSDANPHAEWEIAQLDLVSAKTRAGYTLFALTAE
jgi:hypothetical protein